ncbi:NAD(P)H-binding protein [Rhizobium sp. Root1204]|uniref:SDR family oxidoreductase n=1 Tax=Rhizobium sp. Root1204 TaxID=1736428 RepID=UPI000714A0C1|nr:NAD(P)H-binding protein [Rhizobium sp. Root1204]KQV36352.1 NmrA family transcriptional regulator [Rhizobium sp. Root1204]
MKAVIIGGSGFIGSKVAKFLKDAGHKVVAASRRSGIDAVTGTGVAEAMKDADVVIDVSNSPSFEEKDVFEFFTKSSSNATRCAKNAGVGHYIALSIVGVDDLHTNAYFRAKVAQEEIVKNSTVPYTIVRATQFFEFLSAIAYTPGAEDVVRVSTAFLQPVASDDVSTFIATTALSAPKNGIVEIAGPERDQTDVIIRAYLSSKGDARNVVGDPEAEYFGAKLEPTSLVPVGEYHKGATSLSEWGKIPT